MFFPPSNRNSNKNNDDHHDTFSYFLFITIAAAILLCLFRYLLNCWNACSSADTLYIIKMDAIIFLVISEEFIIPLSRKISDTIYLKIHGDKFCPLAGVYKTILKGMTLKVLIFSLFVNVRRRVLVLLKIFSTFNLQF